MTDAMGDRLTSDPPKGRPRRSNWHASLPPGPFWQGRDLAVKRVRRGLLQRDVAVRLGVCRQRVGMIEHSWRPSSAVVDRYLRALSTDEDGA